jgi:hypothetical protein
VTVRIDHNMEMLEAAAEAQDESRFVRAAMAIDWHTCQPDELLRAIKLSLAAGAYIAARDLSALGHGLFPGDPSLSRFAETLAPPKVVATRPARDPGIRANRDWLKSNCDEYRGKWVGLRNGVLLGAADSLDELRERGLIAKDTLITRVY